MNPMLMCFPSNVFNYDIFNTLICRRNRTVAPLDIYYQEVFLSHYLELSGVYGIPFFKYRGYYTHLYTATSLHHLTGFLCSHQACPLPVIWLGALTSSTDVNPNPNIPNQCGLQPNVSNRLRSQENNLFPSPQPLLWRCNQYQSMWDPTKYLKQTSGIPGSPSGHEYLRCQTPRFLPTFPNRRRGLTNFPQEPPRLPEI